MATMRGIDVSGWNKPEQIAQFDPQFVMIKATEGVGYVSDGLRPMYKAWRDYAAKTNRIPYTGFYHYARPDLNNSATEEAEAFITEVQAIKDLDGCYPLYALDWEGIAVSYGTSWAQTFLRIVADELKTVPLIYMSSSVTRRYKWTEVSKIARLWVAAYCDELIEQTDVYYWKHWSMWQHASAPIDKDIFMADGKAWRNLSDPRHNQDATKWVITNETDTKIVLEKR